MKYVTILLLTLSTTLLGSSTKQLQELANALQALSGKGSSLVILKDFVELLGPTNLHQVGTNPPIYHLRSLAQSGAECGWQSLYNSLFMLTMAAGAKRTLTKTYQRMVNKENYEQFAPLVCTLTKCKRGARCARFGPQEIITLAKSAAFPTETAATLNYLVHSVGSSNLRMHLRAVHLGAANLIKEGIKLIEEREVGSAYDASDLFASADLWETYLSENYQALPGSLASLLSGAQPPYLSFTCSTKDFGEHAIAVLAIKDTGGVYNYFYTDSLTPNPTSPPTDAQNSLIKQIDLLLNHATACLIRQLALFGLEELWSYHIQLLEQIKLEFDPLFPVYKDLICKNIGKTLERLSLPPEEKKILVNFQKRASCLE